MEATEREGGNLHVAQSAALLVVSGTLPGVAGLDRLVDVRVDDHPAPVGEIKRQLAYGRIHARAHSALSKVVSGHTTEALADLDACCAAYPPEPEFLTLRALVLVALDRRAGRGGSRCLQKLAILIPLPQPRSDRRRQRARQTLAASHGDKRH